MPDRSTAAPRLGDRIIVIGNTNAGKSTLGLRLAAHLDVPHIELDALYWRPGWTGAPPEEFAAAVADAVNASERWVLSGNYITNQAEVSWPLADQVVWLDLPLRVVLPRVVRRSWRRYRDRELLWGTNRERFWQHLKLWDPGQSLIAFAITAHRGKRQRYAEMMADPRWAHIDFVRLRSRAEIDAWLEAALSDPTSRGPAEDVTGDEQWRSA